MSMQLSSASIEYFDYSKSRTEAKRIRMLAKLVCFSKWVSLSLSLSLSFSGWIWSIFMTSHINGVGLRLPPWVPPRWSSSIALSTSVDRSIAPSSTCSGKSSTSRSSPPGSEGSSPLCSSPLGTYGLPFLLASQKLSNPNTQSVSFICLGEEGKTVRFRKWEWCWALLEKSPSPTGLYEWLYAQMHM